MFKRFRDYYNVYETAIPRIFRYQLFAKVILIPASIIFRRLLRWLFEITGVGVISNTNILGFLLHPASLLLILMALVMAVFYTVFDVNAILLLSTDVLEGRRRSVTELITASFKELRHLWRPSGFLLLLYLALARPFTGVGISMTLTKNLHPISAFLQFAGGNRWLMLALVLLIILITIFAFFYLYSLHFTLLGKTTPLEGFSCSRRLVFADPLGAIKAYFFMIWGIAFPADLISFVFRNLLPNFLMNYEVPLTICFATLIFGFLLQYTFSILVAPLQILRLTEYYLSRVQPERMVRPEREKRTWIILRMTLFTAVGLLFGLILSSMLPILNRHIAMTSYEGIVAQEIETRLMDISEVTAQMQETDENLYVRLWSAKDVDKFTDAALTEASNSDRVLFIEFSGTEASKENLEELCSRIEKKGNKYKVYLILGSSKIAGELQEEYPELQIGLRIVEGIGNVGTLGADCYVYESGSIKGRQIADLQSQNRMVCLEIQDPLDYYERFMSLEEYPDVVISPKADAFRILCEDMKDIRGDEWVFRMLMWR